MYIIIIIIKTSRIQIQKHMHTYTLPPPPPPHPANWVVCICTGSFTLGLDYEEEVSGKKVALNGRGEREVLVSYQGHVFHQGLQPVFRAKNLSESC